ncbi:hypothetical protein GH733_004789 [Mirounga leonina]|nr:hypothetical protein GH733_004789 [Mirounga leonina]
MVKPVEPILSSPQPPPICHSWRVEKCDGMYQPWCAHDQPGDLLQVEAKDLGVSILIEQLKGETLALKMKQVMGDKRYLVGWIDQILQTGGAAHLKSHAFQQPWHEQYLLDVFLFLLVVTLCTIWLCRKLLGMVRLCGARKLKQMYKSAAVIASIIRHSYPVSLLSHPRGWWAGSIPASRRGVAHLKPHTFQQPRHEQYLLNILFLPVVILGNVRLRGKLLSVVVSWLCGARKQKKT